MGRGQAGQTSCLASSSTCGVWGTAWRPSTGVTFQGVNFGYRLCLGCKILIGVMPDM